MKLIVWDFDGTLADSRPLIEAGMAHALGALGQPRALMGEWLTYVGLPVEEGIRRTFDPVGLDMDTVLKAYRSFGHADHEHLMKPFEGVSELLLELKARGQAMAIATSKRRVPLLRQLEGFGWTGLFDPIITPDEVAQGKPHPESLELIQKLTGLGAEDLLMVGDTPFDLDMARAAGVPSLAVGHGFYSEPRLAACAPRAYAPDTAALRDILLAWSAPCPTT
ncbi:MAG TPA: HAD family hydrolase [Holophagaceae bacterium]|jgi:phosphoglycolate phosphatase|nr:HAD family hydrolase [Holophagaceae bacterium]